MMSRVSLERFTDNLGVLAGIVQFNGYNPDMDKKEAFSYWMTLVKHLKDSDFFKRKEETEAITGKLTDLVSSVYGSSADSGKRKTVSSSSPEN